MSTCLHETGRENIFIGGFMCSGKTSVGRELARRLGWSFTDTDIAIEERAGMTVPEILRQFIHKWLLTTGGTPANTVYMEWQ
ncbi:MAG: shikimate kinase, partial [Synergistaceae bacterium]|nr:shikimate kinase [Synergistaceae bacterium]